MSKPRNIVLTEEIIKQKTKQKLDEVKNLNMWGYDLIDVSIISKMPNLEVISLSLNHISTLFPFKDCKKLRDLFLRNNNISDVNEVHFLKDLKELRTLWLSQNPITQDSNYRLRVIKILPQLKKLDELDITEDERNKAKALPAEKFLPDLEISKSNPSPQKRILNLTQKKDSTNDSDAPLITAINALLPELSNQSLDVVIKKILELKKIKC